MNFSWQNVVDGHGLGLMITGMLIVFCGLCLISGIIVLMGSLDGKNRKTKKAPVPVDDAKADKAPTKEDNKTGLILVSNIRSRRYCPLSSQITIPLIPL